MIVRVSRITLILPSRSLKEKRGILKSVIERVSNRFRVSIAEVDSNDMPDIGVLHFLKHPHVNLDLPNYLSLFMI